MRLGVVVGVLGFIEIGLRNEDELALLEDDEVSAGTAGCKLDELVYGGPAGILINPPGALPTFVQAPSLHF